MKDNSRNIIVKAVQKPHQETFDLYLFYHGQAEYILTHRRNAPVYQYLSRGVTLGELRDKNHVQVAKIALRTKRKNDGTLSHAAKCTRIHSQRVENTLRHLLNCIEEYLEYEAPEILCS